MPDTTLIGHANPTTIELEAVYIWATSKKIITSRVSRTHLQFFFANCGDNCSIYLQNLESVLSIPLEI